MASASNAAALANLGAVPLTGGTLTGALNGTNFSASGTLLVGATDPTNYLRGSLGSTSTAVQLVAQSAGTGAANVDIQITPKGTGNLVTSRGINIGGATGDAGASSINASSFINLSVAGVAKFAVGGAQNFSNQQMIATSGIVFRSIASQTPGANGDLCIETTSNSVLTFKYRGSDGTTRTATLALV